MAPLFHLSNEPLQLACEKSPKVLQHQTQILRGLTQTSLCLGHYLLPLLDETKIKKMVFKLKVVIVCWTERTLEDGGSSLRSMKTPALIFTSRIIMFCKYIRNQQNYSPVNKPTPFPHSMCFNLGVVVCIFYQYGMAVMHFREHHVPILLTGQVCVAISTSFLGKEGRGHPESKWPRWRDESTKIPGRQDIFLENYVVSQPHSNIYLFSIQSLLLF